MKALFLAAAIAALSVGQSVGRLIEGSWTATFEGRTFIRLEMRTANGAITGAMSIGNFELDTQGLVRRADDAPPNLTPIVDVTVRGSNVSFARKDVDDTDQFLLRLLDTGDAELQLLLNDDDREELAASGVPLPKPIPLRKAGQVKLEIALKQGTPNEVYQTVISRSRDIGRIMRDRKLMPAR